MDQERIKIIRKKGTPVGEVDGVFSFLALLQEGTDDAAHIMVHVDAEGRDPTSFRATIENACWMETSAYRVTPRGLHVQPDALVIRS